MTKHFKLATLTLIMVGLMVGGVALYGNFIPGVNAAEKGTVSMMDFEDHAKVGVMNPKPRGTSDLVRTVDGLSMNIDTTDLPVGAYTAWWIIFNNPGGCTPSCSMGADTGKGGMPNPAEGSIMWATGGIVGPDRMGHFSASLRVGLENAPGQVARGPGLLDPMGADVMLALRYHGPTLWSDAEALLGQISTSSGSCKDFGGCYDPQVALHTPSGGSMSP